MALAASVVYEVFPLPWQIVLAEGDGVVGIPTDGVTVTVALAHAVVMHVPVART